MHVFSIIFFTYFQNLDKGPRSHTHDSVHYIRTGMKTLVKLSTDKLYHLHYYRGAVERVLVTKRFALW